jgi:diguanylate cyclase (GGDEF)-like protein
VKILVADDSEMTRMILEGRLKQWGYEVINACDGKEAWEIFQKRGHPRIALIDWMMPQMNGIELLKKIRQHNNEPYIYTILLTAKKGKDNLVEAMNAGADDFISKPFDPHILKVRLRAGMRITRLQEELIAAREALRVQATHDSLTQLFNRSALMDMFTREISRAKRDQSSIGILMVDLDHFKRVNDTYGHLVGDQVLKQIASQMKTCTRQYDIIGRYGGEEFIIILPRCGENEVLCVAERLRSSISDTSFETSAGMINLSISLGATWVTPSEQECQEEDLIRIADKALYDAKNNGRNCTILSEYQKN